MSSKQSWNQRVKQRREQFVTAFDGRIWTARKKGGKGTVFAESEDLALARAQTWAFGHRIVLENNKSGTHSYDPR
ncbi:MAG TPA: hypothetical protein VKR59_04645 [Terriglobales bacterium]|nr:hypothetical protein [Terriglobales bacterium]